METILPAVFDNRHEKMKWTITPIILIAILLLGIFLPMMILVGRNFLELMIFFAVAVVFCVILGLWYHLTVPFVIVLDPNYIIMEKFFKKDVIPLDFVLSAKRGSSGVLVLKMFLYHITNYFKFRNMQRV
jgi:hypothetical protein